MAIHMQTHIAIHKVSSTLEPFTLWIVGQLDTEQILEVSNVQSSKFFSQKLPVTVIEEASCLRCKMRDITICVPIQVPLTEFHYIHAFLHIVCKLISVSWFLNQDAFNVYASPAFFKHSPFTSSYNKMCLCIFIFHILTPISPSKVYIRRCSLKFSLKYD